MHARPLIILSFNSILIILIFFFFPFILFYRLSRKGHVAIMWTINRLAIFRSLELDKIPCSISFSEG